MNHNNTKTKNVAKWTPLINAEEGAPTATKVEEGVQTATKAEEKT